ncbi:S1C family serine protease [Rubricoccus marinus]|uniref:2-alkenal reductase n=1 Tax=Rubricoccus marinus TaxID=716817 RepID=A0A259U223_9BACT|nr:trypsin-like peptidase domain-containing protein [Rubricoccus marinus]OZC04049.1 2-alkenal reductase [Rubricoccus marinus]
MRLTAFFLLLVLIGCDRSAQSQQPQSVDAPLGEVADALERTNVEIDSGRRTAITRAVEAASPAVVSVNVIEVRQVRVRDPFAGFFGRVPDQVYQQQVQGLGSGFVISPDGYIVTNDHVAGNATKITVAFPDGKTMDAQLIGSDPETDIALIKVTPEEDLPFLDFENREDAIVGEWAIALGNPFGLFEAAEPSVTVGVVSAVGRDFPMQEGRTFRDMIQTDAAINSGNSGGPLVDATGRVLGMNTFIFSRTGGSVGIGFAVPAWRIERVVEELRTSGVVNRSFYSGLNVQPINARIVQALGLNDARGLIVASVDPDSPADRAGLRPYDIIVRIAGETIGEVRNPRGYIQDRLIDNRAGDTVTLGIVRDGREQNVNLTLGASG